MKFDELSEFKKDMKRLLKKYRSLESDLATVKQVLEVFPDERPPFSFRISNLSIETCVIKVKKIACQSLKGKGVNSGLRLVYAYFSDDKVQEAVGDDLTEDNKKDKVKEAKEMETGALDKNEMASNERIVFVELYHKNEKPIEDKDRILRNFV